MTVNWSSKPFAALDTLELHDLVRLRVDVFVVEQQCAYPELDGRDTEALHLLGKNEHGQLVAYARILPAAQGGVTRIGRLVVHPEYRGKGLAHQLMRNALVLLQSLFGTRRSMLSAQSHLETFYAAHGFERVGANYDMDGIPHLDMELAG
jgi:ElaA protein